MKDDYVTVWLLDDDGNTKIKSQLPKDEVIYAASRIMKELNVTAEKAFDMGVYAVFLKVTWGL